MRILVTGATGNVGSRVVDALVGDPAVTGVIALARRVPRRLPDGVEFVAADVACDPLATAMRGIDVVIHLAWLVQPGRSESITRRVNVDGTRRVLEAAVWSGVGAISTRRRSASTAPGPRTATSTSRGR